MFSLFYGTYHHLVYQYGSNDGFINVPSATVQVWQRDTNGAVVNSYTQMVTAAPQQTTCAGRFWNTFQ